MALRSGFFGMIGLVGTASIFGCSVETTGRDAAGQDGANSCVGHCGEAAPSGCGCDAECADEGDCCPDAEDVCSLTERDDLAWIGSPCRVGEGNCDFEADGVDAECLEYEDGDGNVNGFCSVPCEGFCADKDGFASTFCTSIEDKGQCVARAESSNGDCGDIPGTRSRFSTRFVGGSGASPIGKAVCVPDTRTGEPSGDLAADLLALTQDCKRMGGTQLFRTDAGRSRTIPICELDGAIWWRADGDIDCDGGRTSPCTEDPWYQASTSSKDSTGRFVDSANVPHFVVPMSGSGFDPKSHGIRTSWNAYGSAGAIIYDGKLLFAPYADAGPRHVVGELSAAAAEELGIPNHPVSGGVSGGVTYIIFTGDNTYVSPIESRSAAETLGEELAQRLIERN